MTDTPSLQEKISALTNVISAAKAALKNDQPIDLSGLEKTVESLCADIQSVPATEARGLRDTLISLTDEISRLEDEIRTEYEKTGGELGSLNQRQRATEAYGDANPKPPASTPETKK